MGFVGFCFNNVAYVGEIMRYSISQYVSYLTVSAENNKDIELDVLSMFTLTIYCQCLDNQDTFQP